MNRAGLEAHIRATPVTGSPNEMRDAFARRVGHVTEVAKTSLGGCAGRMFGTGSGLIVWLHGGGYVFGSSRTHSVAASCLAALAGCRVFVPDYSRAPETPWQGIVDAVAELLRALGPVPVVGDSSGGHLALTLALRMPGSVTRLALISPNTDRSGLSLTRSSRGDLMNDDAGDRALARLAMKGIADTDPRASPLLADLSHMPPVWLTAATNEVLLDDALLMVGALGRAGVPVAADILPGLFHLWPLWPNVLTEAKTTLAAAAAHLTASD